MGLARAGYRSTVVETESIHLMHAGGQGREVIEGQQRLLRLESAAHDQQVVIQDVELVQYGDVVGGDLADQQLRIRWEERVEATLHLFGLRLAFSLLQGCDVDDKRNSLVLDDDCLRRNGDQGSSLPCSISDRSDSVPE